MTNEMIIFNESQRLAAEGVIKYTGREFTVEDADGNQMTIKETEPIHTYNAWKAMGFQVKKGQKAVAQFTIWKHKGGGKNEETGEDEPGRMFMKRSSFFTAAQVEAI